MRSGYNHCTAMLGARRENTTRHCFSKASIGRSCPVISKRGDATATYSCRCVPSEMKLYKLLPDIAKVISASMIKQNAVLLELIIWMVMSMQDEIVRDNLLVCTWSVQGGNSQVYLAFCYSHL